MRGSCAQRRHTLVVLFSFAAFLIAPAAAAEIFRCVAKGGLPLYQNFPCNIDSLGLPSNPSAAKTPPAPVAVNPEQPKIGASTSPRSTSTADALIGMTADEVKALLGEPEEMVYDEPAEGGPVSLWRYADGRSVQFDHKHRVLEVQR